MTRLVLVRHGETPWHADNRYTGSSDLPLTPRGRAQAARLAHWARDAGLTALWTSPLTRARATAAPVAHATGLRPRHDERLRELHFGRAEGLTAAEMAATFPARLAAFHADPAANPLPGGEDPYKAAHRAVTCLGDIADAHPGGRVLVVTHATLLRLVLCHWLSLPLGDYRRVFPGVDNATLTEVRLADGRAALLRLNSRL
ncbi:histidine phosphatase family protein [Streptomyces gamaensis]|uniref:Histidine phosphatase family protein n=1 Tax=Streptomyces gamaensis TaxID=1763542 RepID=A0ABW0Z5V0_9ACTN